MVFYDKSRVEIMVIGMVLHVGFFGETDNKYNYIIIKGLIREMYC